MRIWLAETLMSFAFELVAKLPHRRAEALRFTISNYFMRWRDAPTPVRVSVCEQYGFAPPQEPPQEKG